MAKIALISCVSKKLNRKAKARELYTSALFKGNLLYARQFNSAATFILSAKYGLLSLDEEIEPYDITLNKINNKARKEWAEKVLNQLKKVSDLDKDEYIFLAGENYRKYLLPFIKHYSIPMQGLGIGKQLKFLKEKNSCQTKVVL